MLWARLVKPETLCVNGNTFDAGDALPLTKGQAQQLAKALRREGIEAEFEYEDRQDDQLRERHNAKHQDDTLSGSGVAVGAGFAGRRNGPVVAPSGERPRRGRPRKSGI
jgi:hypothetical protein